MTEQPTEHIEMSDQDEKDLQKMLDGGKEPEFHTVLEVWQEVLSNAPVLANDPVTPQWASKMVGTYPGVTFADTPLLHRGYFQKIMELGEILNTEISHDPDCLTYDKAEDDAANNSQHYKNLLRDWQLTFLQWEMDWDPTTTGAACELGAISEVHKMFFGQTGIVPYLDQIKFEFTDQDQQELADALAALRDSQVTRDE